MLKDFLAKLTPSQMVAGALLAVIVVAVVGFLPDEHAWTLLGQITAGLMKGLVPQ